MWETLSDDRGEILPRKLRKLYHILGKLSTKKEAGFPPLPKGRGLHPEEMMKTRILPTIITGTKYQRLTLKFLLIIPLTEARIFCKLRFYAKDICAEKGVLPNKSPK